MGESNGPVESKGYGRLGQERDHTFCLSPADNIWKQFGLIGVQIAEQIKLFPVTLHYSFYLKSACGGLWLLRIPLFSFTTSKSISSIANLHIVVRLKKVFPLYVFILGYSLKHEHVLITEPKNLTQVWQSFHGQVYYTLLWGKLKKAIFNPVQRFFPSVMSSFWDHSSWDWALTWAVGGERLEKK